MQEKSISSWKCSDSISWTLYMHLPQTKSVTNIRHTCDLREVLSKSGRHAISDTLALREVHVQCLPVITALQATYRFSGVLPLVPLYLGIIKCIDGYYRKRLVQNAVFKLNSMPPNTLAVDVKNACDWISGSWNSVKISTIQNCWKIASFFEGKGDEKMNVDITEIAKKEEECVAYESSSNQSSHLTLKDS
ncbi:hypothetical protein AVEN_259859-2 [Araneus ventricosus]|uniref:DDE-1 domain-containing protein n=1 Tax=Araneus ventricosus TaxID=182803 RepID=A0A4Y2DR96_ARAVE|nr:hypothetical protein AVEN_259859-2 [Araneus ventricosus]